MKEENSQIDTQIIRSLKSKLVTNSNSLIGQHIMEKEDPDLSSTDFMSWSLTKVFEHSFSQLQMIAHGPTKQDQIIHEENMW